MKGAAMSLTAAVSGFVALLTVSVVQGQNDWSVTYTSTQICAFKGSTVDIRCRYSYPSTVHSITTTVQDRFWFVKNNEKPVHLKAHSHRFEYRFHENDCTLRITGLRERDSAEYKFRFKTNQDGGSFTGSPGVALTVTDLQVKVRRSSMQTELQCHTSCHVTDPPSYVWYNKGQKLKEETSSLRVSVRDDDSSYSCAVKGHEDHRAAPVFSPKLYYMLVSPSAETVEGSSITLNCGFTANPAANYTWYKGNSQRYLSEGTVLGLESIQPSDSGEYHCTAENELGRTSESIFINVKYAPKVATVSVSPSAEIVEGSSVTLTCSSDANPAANYTWYKENKHKPLSVDTQLVFSSIQLSDSGEYHCRAYNQVGETSKSISIHVKYPPKLVSVSASPSNEIKEGRSVTLTCNSDANPAAKHFWYKDGDPNPLSNEWKLSFSSVQSSDSGQYFCAAENNLGRRTSESIFIVVIYGPKFLSVSVSPSGEIQEGSSVTLTCSSDANPAANYTWYKEDGQAPLIVEPQLVFNSIQPSDSGEYYCTALNKVMTSTTESVSVDVMHAPKLPSVSVSPSAEIVEGSSVTLTCSTDANPAAKYTWYKEGDQTSLSKEPQLIFSSIQPSDSGEYYCTAENKMGMSTPKYISIDVTYAPKLPFVSVSPSGEIVEGSSVTLTCSSDANPAANYTWYKEDEDSPKASGQNFTITDFRLEHSGSYYCEAQNTRGRHYSTLELTVVSATWKLAAVSVPAVLLALILSYSVILWIIKKRSSKQKQPEPEERTDTSEQVQPEEDSVTCTSVYFCNHRVDPVCSIRTAAQTKRHKKKEAEEEGMVERAAHTSGSSHHQIYQT